MNHEEHLLERQLRLDTFKGWQGVASGGRDLQEASSRREGRCSHTVRKRTLTPSEMTADDVAFARAAGWSEDAIFDAVCICGFSSLMNRVVDAVGLVNTDEQNRESGRRLASTGYEATMALAREAMAPRQRPLPSALQRPRQTSAGLNEPSYPPGLADDVPDSPAPASSPSSYCPFRVGMHSASRSEASTREQRGRACDHGKKVARTAPGSPGWKSCWSTSTGPLTVLGTDVILAP